MEVFTTGESLSKTLFTKTRIIGIFKEAKSGLPMATYQGLTGLTAPPFTNGALNTGVLKLLNSNESKSLSSRSPNTKPWC